MKNIINKKIGHLLSYIAAKCVHKKIINIPISHRKEDGHKEIKYSEETIACIFYTDSPFVALLGGACAFKNLNDTNTIMVYYDENRDELLQKFIEAHEVGHIINARFGEEDGIDSMEKEYKADLYAMHYLDISKEETCSILSSSAIIAESYWRQANIASNVIWPKLVNHPYFFSDLYDQIKMRKNFIMSL